MTKSPFPQRFVRPVPTPTGDLSNLDPHIAESIRRTRMLEAQQQALELVAKELDTTSRQLRKEHKRTTKRRRCEARRRARQASATTIDHVDRGSIIARDKRTCYLCGTTNLANKDIHLDHVIPLSRGGAHSPNNIRVACVTCNTRKAALTEQEYRATLKPSRA